MKPILFLFALFFGVILWGCGVNRAVHEQTNQDLLVAKQEVGKLQGAFQEARQRIKQLEKSIEEFRETNKQLEDDLEDARNELAQVSERLRLRIRDLDQEVSSLRNQNQELLEMRSTQASEIDKLSQLSETLKVEKEETTQQLKSTYEELVKELEGEIEEGAIKITQVKEKLSMNLVDKILFDSGSSNLKAQGVKVLKKVGKALKKITEKEIRVEGHTDNVPVSSRISQKFPSNWELSTARATTVARYLQEKEGVDPRRLSASGYASYRPVATNENPEGKAQNRRIEIVLVPLDLTEVLKELN